MIQCFENEYTDFDDDEEDDIDLNKLDPMAVVINFVEHWVNGEYDIAYRLLASDSPLRQGLAKKEWIEQRDTWADQVEPGELQPNLIQERKAQRKVSAPSGSSLPLAKYTTGVYGSKSTG